MGKRPNIYDELGDIEGRSWWLWTISLSISITLALGFILLFVPTLKAGIAEITLRHVTFLPQLLVGLMTLVVLASIYIVVKQRELNQMRRLVISTYADGHSGWAAYPQDSITGLLDRRALPDILEMEAARANRYRAPFCMVLSDIQGFRKVNEQLGNLAGDLILKGVGKILQTTARKTDVAVRYGPDEFLCLLPATDSSGGEHFIQRVSKAIEGSPSLHAVSLDFALATYQPGADADIVLGEAEREIERKRIRRDNPPQTSSPNP
ncbi:MAG: GGDEF domain-containing protein [Terriglobia bacterium]